ncbi:MAG: hypothetical protein Q7S26_02445 [bacterium]|nr:hypothetical protein [bacterium]
MRNNLIQLLRAFDRESIFENEYNDSFGDEHYDYSVEEHIGFPNYRTIDRLYVARYLNHLKSVAPSNSIKAELKRMEADGLVMIGTQKGVKYSYAGDGKGFDYDEGVSFTTESIVLTTKGQSGWRYFLYQAKENPFNVVAIGISVIALIVSVVK